jgi:GntR family transcriptional regulator
MIAEIPAGRRLASERELAERFSVARMTLRRAMDTLINRGLLERRAGSGTYVVKPLVASELRLASFSEEIRARGLTPRTEVISFRRKRATRSSALQLRIPENEDIFVFTRLRFADEDPVAIETTKIPCQYVPELSEELLTDSFYDLLFNKFGILIVSAKTEISAINLDTEQAKLLDAPVLQPSLELEMKDFDQNGRLIMAAHCIYRADKYKLSIQANSGVRNKSMIENRTRKA